ncbi:DUF2231 domain-containing protein [Glycomyces arizonensis]|uniref:DUF2231 domain-containing protein n=1 Tax=Glycomyces arizonensis TaxID=256035 RepID=UPI0004262509|nr:DUF2231 domain-containing protein [Glycomyces arizonensis]
MTTILDLPVHPLAVHAPVVFVPLLVLFGLAYLFVPPLRRRVGWACAALTLIAPAAAFGAIWSGQQLADHLYPGGWPEAVQEHHDLGYRLLWILVGLAPVWWLFAALDRGRRAAAARDGDAPAGADEDGSAPVSTDAAASGRKVVMLILGIVALALLALAAWTVFQSGDTGASMVWGDTAGS